jgi:hypothetical protein
MRSRSPHPGLRQLLLYADGELSARATAGLLKHLAGCAECNEQLRQMKTAGDDLAAAQQATVPGLDDISGPRALLNARLEELARLYSYTRPGAMRLARSLAYACALVVPAAVGLIVMRQGRMLTTPYARLRPDPSFTPGLTRAVSLTDLCSVGHDEVVRTVPAALQQRVLHEYGISSESPADFEVDYLITPGLGGADDLRNLWPQPHAHTVWNSYVKDQLEDRLHGMVCDGKLSLTVAQQEIAVDWIAAYKKYFHAEQPIANPMHAELAQRSY